MIDPDEFATHIGKVFAFMDEASGEEMAFPDRDLDASDIIVNFATALDVELIDSADIGATMTAAVLDALKPTPAADEVEAVARAIGNVAGCSGLLWDTYNWGGFEAWREEKREEARAAIAALQGHPAKHADDAAVDRFAAAMKAKLAQKRAEGRGGWENRDECSGERLSSMLRDHVAKGDPVDVANFAMMLHQRGERIAPAEPAGEEPVAWLYTYSDGTRRVQLDRLDPPLMEGSKCTETLMRPATPSNPERLVGDPLGMEEIDLDLMRKREVQAMGAALSTRNWHDMESAYNALRDKVDRELGRRFRIAKASAAQDQGEGK